MLIISRVSIHNDIAIIVDCQYARWCSVMWSLFIVVDNVQTCVSGVPTHSCLHAVFIMHTGGNTSFEL